VTFLLQPVVEKSASAVPHLSAQRSDGRVSSVYPVVLTMMGARSLMQLTKEGALKLCYPPQPGIWLPRLAFARQWTMFGSGLDSPTAASWVISWVTV